MTTKDNVTPSILYKSNLWREDDIILFFLFASSFHIYYALHGGKLECELLGFPKYGVVF